jgi:putative membrane protein
MDRRTALLGFGLAGLATAVTRPALALGEGPTVAVLQAGAFSMQTSQLAIERARNPRLRDFAQLEANEQMAVAAALGAAPGSVPLRPDQAQMVQQLSSMSGARFDAMYLKGQIAGHEELLALNEPIARGGGMGGREQSVALVAVPAIQTHLYMLRNMRRG